MGISDVKTLKESIVDGDIKFKNWLKSFSPEIFEVVFSDVVKGRGPSAYLNPEEFFSITQMTHRMKDVLQWCISRTAGLNNKGTIYLATGFGGGKSHLLLLLYHTFVSKKIIDPHLLMELSLQGVPDVKVVAIDGHNLSFPMSNDSELGLYLKETKEKTIQALKNEGKPVVFLIDELVVFLAKQKNENQRKEIANLHTLLSAVNSTDNCVIVVTNPKGSTAYGKEVETLDSILRKNKEEETATDVSSLLGRVTQPIVPVEKDDFVAILKKRLVDHVDSNTAKNVESFLSRRLKIDFTGFYPFHPLLIDVLYERISLFPNFQKTRDALKIVALAIKGLLMNKEFANFYVLSPAEMPLEDSDLRSILTNERVFGSNLEQAVTKDIIKSSYEADNHKKYGKFRRLTSTVFMYSLHPEISKRGATTRQVFLCLTDEKVEIDVEKILNCFYNEYSTFMWLEESRFLFKAKQNVPNMIKIQSHQIIHASVEAYISKTLFSTIFERFNDNACIFYRPQDYFATPNRLNVIVPLPWDNVEEITSNFLSINANLKNTNIVMVPDRSNIGPLEYYSKLTVAAEQVKKLVKEDKMLFKEAKKLAQEYETQALQQFRSMYSKIRFLVGTKIKEIQIDPLKGVSIRDALIVRLKETQKLLDLDTVEPRTYLETLLGARTSVQIRNAFSDIETMTSLPFTTRSGLKKVISKGVYEGSIGLLKGILPEDGQLSGRESIVWRTNSYINVNDEDTILSANYAKDLFDKLEKIKKEKCEQKEEPETEEKEETIQDAPLIPEIVDTFVADASQIYQTLNEKWSQILFEGVEARVTVRFSGTVTGTITANNREEISSIIDLTDGLKKASKILGGVKATVSIYKNRGNANC